MGISPKNIPDFLKDGGEMGALIRDLDWVNSPVGTPETWSPILQSQISKMLNSHFAAIFWWGPELVQFYNDAYISALGIKHPTALGLPAKICFAEN